MPEPTEPEYSDDDDRYANSYWWLHKTLSVLAECAEKQCELMEYDHVAWQIRDDASSWIHPVLALSESRLSNEQRELIGRLLIEVSSVPDSVVMVPNVKKAHLLAMDHPCWVPIRAHAKKIIPCLETETQRVHDILWPDGE